MSCAPSSRIPDLYFGRRFANGNAQCGNLVLEPGTVRWRGLATRGGELIGPEHSALLPG